MGADEFAGLSFIVTGAASGIGKAIAETIADRGGCVIAVDRSRDGLARLQAYGARIVPVELDLADLDRLKEMESSLPQLLAETGTRLAGAVNCAAVVGVSSVTSQQASDWDHLFAVNLRAPMVITQIVARHVSPKAGASVVHVSSTAALVAREGLAAYASSKAALEQLTKVQAIELANHGIRVNAVRVGLVDTEGVRAAAQDAESRADHQRKIARIPLKREGSPAEIAEMVTFLLGERSGFCTGGVYPIDGGYSAGVAAAG